MFCMFFVCIIIVNTVTNVSGIVTSSVFLTHKKVDIVISKEEAVNAVLSLLK